MQLPKPFIRLPFQFDAEQLAEEVDALPDDAWRRHPTGHKGNTAVSLVSVNGDFTDDSIGGPQAPTSWLTPGLVSRSDDRVVRDAGRTDPAHADRPGW